jgi:hypothetical protein
MRLIKMLVVVVSLIVFAGASSQKDYSVCSKMISDAAHNVGISTASYDYADSIWEQNCEQDGSIKSSHLDLSVVVKAIPIQFAAGSDEQTVRNFCKTFSQDVRLRTANFSYNSRVVDSSLKSAVQCVDIITKGGGSSVEQSFVGADTLRLSVTAASGQKVVIKGIQPGRNARCVSPGGMLGAVNWDINTNRTVLPNEGTYTIDCTRSATPRPDLGGAAEFFNRTSVVIGTNFGGLDVFWPDQLVQPERDAERIAQNIADLQEQLSKLKARLDAIGADPNDQGRMTYTKGGFFVTYNKDGEKQGCPTGQFVSAIDINWSTLGHVDSAVGDIGVYCRKLVP